MVATFELDRVGRYHLLPAEATVDPRSSSGGALLPARAAGSERACVLELLDPPRGREKRFAAQLLAEAPSAVAFRHPSAQPVLDVDSSGLAARERAPAVIAYEPAAGPTLSSILARAEEAARTLPVRLVLYVALGVADVLARLEATPSGAGAPVCHGSLAPSRIWLDGSGALAVGNVGLARARLDLPRALDVLALQAPELFDGPAALSPAADVHALGMLIFDLLFGRSVHRRDTAPETRRSVLRGVRPRLARVRADVDPNLEALVEWMLAQQPSERPPSLEVATRMLADALQRLDGASSPAQQAGAWVGQLCPTGAAWPGGGFARPSAPDLPEAGKASPDGYAEVLAPAPTPVSFHISAPPEEDPEPAPLAPPPLPVLGSAVEVEIEAPMDWAAGAGGEGAARLAADLPGFYEALDLDPMLPDELEASDFESRYLPLGPLGDGGYGAARDRVTGERVLVERLPPHSAAALERRRQALLPVAPHASLLLPLATWPSSDGVMTVSAPFRPASLAERVAREGPLEPVETARLLEQLLEGLARLHRAGVAHGRLHPDHVLVDGTGSGLQIRLGGLLQTAAGVELADPAFLAPEQAKRGADSLAADVWSVGAVTYFALVGAGPYVASSRASLIGAVEAARPPSIMALRPAARRFDPVLRACLEPEAADRAPSADLVLALLADGPEER